MDDADGASRGNDDVAGEKSLARRSKSGVAGRIAGSVFAFHNQDFHNEDRNTHEDFDTEDRDIHQDFYNEDFHTHQDFYNQVFHTG